MGIQNFYIGDNIWIQVVEVLNETSIAINTIVGEVKLAGIMEFKQMDTNPVSDKNEFYATIKYGAIICDTVDMVRLHEVTGLLVQNHRYVSQIMIQAWFNKFFPYPA